MPRSGAVGRKADMKTKVLDCTIRDGGYLNDWQFSKQLVKDLYRAVSRAGIDYVEVGFRSSNRYFDPSQMGLWRFTPEEAVSEIKELDGAPIALMVDYGKVDLADIPVASRSGVSLYRIAVHRDRALEAIELGNAIADREYEVSIQLMGIVGYSDEDFKRIIGPLRDSRLTFVYFADSYGSLLPADIEKHTTRLRETGKQIGFHAHNNLQLAFANTLEAIRVGIDIVDGTVFGMGRGVGNLPLEALISYFEKTGHTAKFNVLPILELIDKYFLYLYKEFNWGYNLAYMISGIYEVHPNFADSLIESGEYGIEDIQSTLQLIHTLNPIGFDKSIIKQIEQTGFLGKKQAGVAEGETRTVEPYQPVQVTYKDRHRERDFLILANGPSLVLYKDKIDQFVQRYDPVIIGSNYLGGLYRPHYHSFNNETRFIEHISDVDPGSKLLVTCAFPPGFVRKHTGRDYEVIQHSNADHFSFAIEHGVIMNNCKAVSVLSIAVAIVMGAKRIFIAGMDGYKDFETFLSEGAGSRPTTKNAPVVTDISARSGEYREQMEWHNHIDRLLRQINDYLLSNGMRGLTIVTPTSHKLFYRSIDNFLEKVA